MTLAFVRQKYPALLSGLEREGVAFVTSPVANTVMIRSARITTLQSLDILRVIGALLARGNTVVLNVPSSTEPGDLDKLCKALSVPNPWPMSRDT